MKRLAAAVLALLALLSCNTLTRGLAPTPTPAPTDTPEATANPAAQFGLERIQSLPDDCKESPLSLAADKLTEVAYLPTGYCFNGEIDLIETGGRVYTVQSLAFEAAFFIADVTDPAHPSPVGAWRWNVTAYTADVKAFRQGSRWYLALSLEPDNNIVCGVAVVEVTDPAQPKLVDLYSSANTGSAVPWCNTHTAEISTDAEGNGAYIYVSNISTGDLRVLDVRDLSRVREINRYTVSNADPDHFVHDTTIVGARVYVAYWSSGLIILDRAQVEAGQPITPLNAPGSIAPEGLQIHKAYPTADGQFVFVEDEVNYRPPLSQLRLYDIRDVAAPKEVAAIALDSPYSSPHNLLVAGDLLFVGWYTDGVRVFQYDTHDPEHPTVTPFAFKAVRPTKTKGVFGSDIFDGIWGVRLRACTVAGEAATCVYAGDLTRGLIILAMKPPLPFPLP